MSVPLVQYIEDWRGLAPGCLVAQSVGISWLWRLKSDATGSIPAGWVRGVTWVPVLYSSILTSLRKENHLETLALYNPDAELKISADLVAVLLQHEEDTWKPVAYASRSISETEQRYAQIEKEALATTWACEKFSDYVLGRRFLIESDHKPLVPLLNTKQLDSMPPRILRFRLRLARYDYRVEHVPGKNLHAADALSRAQVAGGEEDSCLQTEFRQCLPIYTYFLLAAITPSCYPP